MIGLDRGAVVLSSRALAFPLEGGVVRRSGELGVGRYKALATLEGSVITYSSAGAVGRVDAKRSVANRTASCLGIIIVGRLTSSFELAHLWRSNDA